MTANKKMIEEDQWTWVETSENGNVEIINCNILRQ